MRDKQVQAYDMTRGMRDKYICALYQHFHGVWFGKKNIYTFSNVKNKDMDVNRYSLSRLAWHLCVMFDKYDIQIDMSNSDMYQLNNW